MGLLVMRPEPIRYGPGRPASTGGRNLQTVGDALSKESAYLLCKRAIDILLSALGLLLLLPLLAMAALLVKLTSPGPALFWQTRAGLHGRRFRIVKLRTMYAGSGGAVITTSRDERVTPLGRVLRRSKIDEIPQLWNVLVGDMSLVGPRPQTLRYVRLFPREYERILTVRPGITCSAAVKHRHEESVLAASPDPEATYVKQLLPEKFALYDRYLAERSLWTDLWLIIKTVAVVLGR